MPEIRRKEITPCTMLTRARLKTSGFSSPGPLGKQATRQAAVIGTRPAKATAMSAVCEEVPRVRKIETAPYTPARRFTYLDALRGLLLVIMAINHVPSELHAVTDHPLGYMSAAEGFVFISGLMAGLVYTRHFLQQGVTMLTQSCWRRAGMIYLYHLVGYLCVFALIAFSGHLRETVPTLMSSHPFEAVIFGALLLSQPSMLDILPFYCVFLLVTPLVIRACEKDRRSWVIGISAALWAVANVYSPQRPLIHTASLNSGAFNIFAWQLLFVTGAVLGNAWAHGKRLLPNLSRPVVISFTVLAALLFAVRHAWLPAPVSPQALSWLTNKNNLAPLRLFDTGLLFWLVHVAIVRCRVSPNSKPLELLGRHSLVVFTVHVIVGYVILGWPQFFSDSVLDRALSTALLITLMFSGAAVAEALKRERTQRAQNLSSPVRPLLINLGNGKRTIGPTGPLHYRSG
ncbi:MAG: OpgC domain-containing protein [Nibricoccus sp.]